MKFTYYASRENVPDFKSKAIMKAINWDCSHSLLMVETDEGHKMVFHATGDHKYRDGRKATGFHMIEGDNLAEFLEHHSLHHEVELPVKNPDFALGFCFGNVGKDYSESQLIGDYLPILRVFCGDDDAELVCSEFPLRFVMNPYVMGFMFDKEPDWICPKVCTEIMYQLIGKVMP